MSRFLGRALPSPARIDDDGDKRKTAALPSTSAAAAPVLLGGNVFIAPPVLSAATNAIVLGRRPFFSRMTPSPSIAPSPSRIVAVK